ncbi:MAG TPA: magnesium/cobalt transporter CorA [Acidimicrobiales bacterium]|jgi:magnesium transporter|nr:magnesium/cobalt transporter CorA [Acidimicrobiales bacterium]
MQGTLTQQGETVAADMENVLAALASKEFFWLDLDDATTDGTVAELLGTHFAFHPLAVAAAEKFAQRPRFDDYDKFVYLVARGADPKDDGKAEVHCFWTDTFIVTVHRGDCPAIQGVHDRMSRHHASNNSSPQIVVVYLVMDTLVNGFFPVLNDFDDRIDALEDDILKAPTEAQLGLLFDMKRSLMNMRKVIAPQRDMMASINAGVSEVPGMTDEASRYFRDLYDHLIRLADLVDSYRDLLSSVMDTHLSTVSNRLNVVMKQLAVIATIFLPLTFLTGFFGQNFSYLVNHLITPTWTFWVIGVGGEVVAVYLLYVLFKRRGWLTQDPTV